MEQQFLVLTTGGQINRQPFLSFSGKYLLTRRKLLMINRGAFEVSTKCLLIGPCIVFRSCNLF